MDGLHEAESVRLALLFSADLGSSFTKIDGFISRVVFYSCMRALDDTWWRVGGQIEHCIQLTTACDWCLSVAVMPTMLTLMTSEHGGVG